MLSSGPEYEALRLRVLQEACQRCGLAFVSREQALKLLAQKLLAAKIAVVVAMLLLAALNRLILAPRLHEHNETAMHCLRASIGSESVAAAAVLCLVAVFGTLEPI